MWDIRPTNDGGMIITGKAFKNLVGGFWLLKLDSMGCLTSGCDTLGTDIFEIPMDDNSLAVYPNPAADVLYVQANLTPSTQQATVYLYSIEGKRLESRNIRGNEIALFDLSEYPTGVYLTVLKTGNGLVARRKVVITPR
jgi:hypothetical protein